MWFGSVIRESDDAPEWYHLIPDSVKAILTPEVPDYLRQHPRYASGEAAPALESIDLPLPRSRWRTLSAARSGKTAACHVRFASNASTSLIMAAHDIANSSWIIFSLGAGLFW